MAEFEQLLADPLAPPEALAEDPLPEGALLPQAASPAAATAATAARAIRRIPIHPMSRPEIPHPEAIQPARPVTCAPRGDITGNGPAGRDLVRLSTAA
jgi:hypothetical protein